MDESSGENDIDDSMSETDHSEPPDEFLNTHRYVSALIALDRKHPHEHFEKIKRVLQELARQADVDELTDPDFPLALMKKASEELGYITDGNIADDSEEYYKAISGLLGRPEYEILMSNIYGQCDASDEDIIQKVEGALLEMYREMGIEDFSDPNILDILEYRLYELLQSGEYNECDKTSNSI